MTANIHRKPDGRTSILLPSGFVLNLLQPDATGLPITDIALCLASQPYSEASYLRDYAAFRGLAAPPRA